MACYHPLEVFYRIRSEDEVNSLDLPLEDKIRLRLKKDITFKQPNKRFFYVGGKLTTEIDDFVVFDGKMYDKKLLLRCGQCIGCRLDHSKQWAARCMLEAQEWEHNFFITLTYDDVHLSDCRRHNYVFNDGSVVFEMNSSSSGVWKDLAPLDCWFFDDGTSNQEKTVIREFDSYTLVKKHAQDFIKRLRRYFSYHFNHDNIRVFYCGEYGSLNNRPHFHFIFFNLPLPKDDLVFWQQQDGYSVYRSYLIESLWDKGFSTVGNCTYETCAYVARYVLKKHKGKTAIYYRDNGLVPEFVEMSRKPGIAYKYFSDHKDSIYRFDNVQLLGPDGKTLKINPPDYFDRLYEDINPEHLACLKAERAFLAEQSIIDKLSRIDLSFREQLEVEEKNHLLRIKVLKREL